MDYLLTSSGRTGGLFGRTCWSLAPSLADSMSHHAGTRNISPSSEDRVVHPWPVAPWRRPLNDPEMRILRWPLCERAYSSAMTLSPGASLPMTGLVISTVRRTFTVDQRFDFTTMNSSPGVLSRCSCFSTGRSLFCWRGTRDGLLCVSPPSPSRVS